MPWIEPVSRQLTSSKIYKIHRRRTDVNLSPGDEASLAPSPSEMLTISLILHVGELHFSYYLMYKLFENIFESCKKNRVIADFMVSKQEKVKNSSPLRR